MFTLVNLTCIIFLYKHAKDGLEWPKLFFGNLYSFECTSWNNPNGQKLLLEQLPMILCHHQSYVQELKEIPLIYLYNFLQ